MNLRQPGTRSRCTGNVSCRDRDDPKYCGRSLVLFVSNVHATTLGISIFNSHALPTRIRNYTGMPDVIDILPLCRSRLCKSFAFSVLAHRHMSSFGRSAMPDEDRASPYTNGNRIQYKAATCRIKLSVEDNSVRVNLNLYLSRV